jgi:hypothetical protein
MKKLILLPLLLCCLFRIAIGQQKKYVPRVEPCNCRFQMDSNFVKTAPANLRSYFAAPLEQIDSSFQTKCGYLIVPENGTKAASKMIKLPFIVVESKNPYRSSTNWFENLSSSAT